MTQKLKKQTNLKNFFDKTCIICATFVSKNVMLLHYKYKPQIVFCQTVLEFYRILSNRPHPMIRLVEVKDCIQRACLNCLTVISQKQKRNFCSVCVKCRADIPSGIQETLPHFEMFSILPQRKSTPTCGLSIQM